MNTSLYCSFVRSCQSIFVARVSNNDYVRVRKIAGFNKLKIIVIFRSSKVYFSDEYLSKYWQEFHLCQYNATLC